MPALRNLPGRRKGKSVAKRPNIHQAKDQVFLCLIVQVSTLFFWTGVPSLSKAEKVFRPGFAGFTDC
jgi:hypothetical protein